MQKNQEEETRRGRNPVFKKNALPDWNRMIKQNYADRKELQDWYGKKILKELPDVNSNNILTKENMHLKDVVEMVCSASVTELCIFFFCHERYWFKISHNKKYDEPVYLPDIINIGEERVRSQFPGRERSRKKKEKNDCRFSEKILSAESFETVIDQSGNKSQITGRSTGSSKESTDFTGTD